MKFIFLKLFVLAIFLNSCHSNNASNKQNISQESSQKVNDFLNKKFDESILRHPEYASSLGLKIGNDSWNDRSDSAEIRELAYDQQTLDTLKKMDFEHLDEQTKLSIRLFEYDVVRRDEGLQWRFHNYWINQMQGEHSEIPAFLINVHKIDSLPDALAYISRINKLPTVFEEVIWQLKKREELGAIPPKFTFPLVKTDIQNFIQGCDKTGESNILLNDFTSKVTALKIDEKMKQELIAKCKESLINNAKPAYQKLENYWVELEKKAVENNGVWALKNGTGYYRFCLKNMTTTDKSPEEIFATGEKEVARIQTEMKGVMKEVNFKSDSLQAFFNFMRTSPQFKYSKDSKGQQELLKESNQYIETFKKEYLDKLFETKPKADVKVMAVEKFREASVGGAFYEDPAEDGSRPGRFYVNLYNMDDEPRYQMEALCYHEAIPGHHMQIALAQELKSIPKFRRHGGNVAYIEGWALYSELIPREVGLYKDPYSNFGRLSMELFRAARLVVDVGIHDKKWTKEQALDYFLKNTANAPGDCKKEIERYFLWPAQATGYKVGMLKILELREKAKNALGSKFDIRKFHTTILMNGSVPLIVLEELVDAYIAQNK